MKRPGYCVEKVPVASFIVSRVDPWVRRLFILSIISRTYAALALAISGSIGTTGSSGGKLGGGGRCLGAGAFDILVISSLDSELKYAHILK